MEGRMLRLPAPKNKPREILMLYGHHASIERMAGLAEELNRYGAVTLPDLPGMGGMDSFYSIGQKPTLDNMADYLAAFVKLRFRRKRLTIVAMSFGFVVATRMLQKHPSLAKKIDLMVSIVGFVHGEDFRYKGLSYYGFRYGASLFSRRIPAWIVQHLLLRGPLIRATYLLVADRHVKLQDASKEERDRRIAFEIGLWQQNDIRTYMDNGITMLTLNLVEHRVDVPLWHVHVEPDRYFDNRIVEQHMHIIFSSVHTAESEMSGHAPTVVATAKDAAPFIPEKVRRVLRKQP